jgi:hypothetical protein
MQQLLLRWHKRTHTTTDRVTHAKLAGGTGPIRRNAIQRRFICVKDTQAVSTYSTVLCIPCGEERRVTYSSDVGICPATPTIPSPRHTPQTPVVAGKGQNVHPLRCGTFRVINGPTTPLCIETRI